MRWGGGGMKARAKEEGGRSERVEWWSVCLDKEFTGVGEEVSEDKRFEGVTTKGAREKEGVRWVARKKGEVGLKSGKEVFIITKESGDGKGSGERVEAHVGGNKGMIEGDEDSGRKAMMHEAFALPAKGGELAVFCMVSGGREVMIYTEVAMKSWSRHVIVGVVELSGNGGCRHRLGRVNPGCVGERGEGGGRRGIVDANAAFVSTNAEFMDNRHVTREFEIVLDEESERGRGRRGEISAGIVTVGMSGETLRGGNVAVVGGRVRG